jgi:hypothetical protein
MQAGNNVSIRFLQEPHGVTSQNTAFFIVTCRENLGSYRRGKSFE